MSKITLMTAWALSAAVLAGCTADPFNGQQIKARTSPLSIGGLVPLPNESIAFRAQNVTASSWSTLRTVRSATWSRVTDSPGVIWYTWNGSVTLPTSRDFWTSRGSGTNRFVDINLKAVGANSGELTTFSDTDADCIAGMFFSGFGGFDIASTCGDGPIMRVRVPCGDKGEACCTSRQHSNSCNSPLTCKEQLCVFQSMQPIPPPGGIGVPPVPSNGNCSEMHGMPCGVPGCGSGDPVTGKWKCQNPDTSRETLTCDAMHGVDYCSRADGDRCGSPLAGTCTDHLDCAPGLLCHAIDKVCHRPSSGLCPQPGDYCWRPKSSAMGGIPRVDFCGA